MVLVLGNGVVQPRREQMMYSAENSFPVEAHVRQVAPAAPARLGATRRGTIQFTPRMIRLTDTMRLGNSHQINPAILDPTPARVEILIMRKLFAKVIRSKNPDKNKPREQQTTKLNDPAETASNDNINNNQQKNTQYPPSQYGIRQEVSGKYLIRRRLANLLEDRFPGRWSLQVCARRSVLRRP